MILPQMYIDRKVSGQITVFLSLLLPVLLGMIGSFLEAARLRGTEAMLQMYTSSALESVFAGYSRELMELYGLMFAIGSEEELNRKFLEYLDYERDPGKEFPAAGDSFFSVDIKKDDYLKELRMSEQGGTQLVDSALAFLKYNNPGAFAVSLLEQLETLGLGMDSASEAEGWKKEFEGTDWSKTEEVETGYSNQEVQDSLLESGLGQLERFAGKGIWNLVKPDGAVLSGRNIPEDGLPSADYRTALPEGAEGLDLLKNPVRTLLFDEYVLLRANCCTDQVQEDGLQYEIEYILAGKKDEEENLYAILNRIAGFRSGLNLMYLMQDEGKKAQAGGAAALALGWTGNPALISAAKYLILAGWSYAEALSDVHILLQGGRVPLLKSADTWNFALENLVSLGSEDLGEDKTQEGLKYQDYLRILLALADGQDKCYRMMDVIQLRMQQTDSTFRAADCTGAAGCTVRGTAGRRGQSEVTAEDYFSYARR